MIWREGGKARSCEVSRGRGVPGRENPNGASGRRREPVPKSGQPAGTTGRRAGYYLAAAR